MHHDKNNTIKKYALLIIDMQNDFVLPGAVACIPTAYETIPAIKKLLDFSRQNHFDVFHIVREYRADGTDAEFMRSSDFLSGKKYAVPGTLGCKIVSELAPVDGEYTIVKNRFSAFMNTELDFILRRKQITDLIVCGAQYPNCIRSTIFDAICFDYRVVNITDTTVAKTRDIAEANIVDIRNIGVPCVTFEEFKTMVKEMLNE